MRGKALRTDRSAGKRGFTLVELLIVLVIVAILSAVAIPSLASWYQHFRTNTVARQLMTDLLYARMTAVSQKAACVVTLTAASNQYTIVQNGANVVMPRQLSFQYINNNTGDGGNPYYAPGVVLGTNPISATWTVSFSALGVPNISPANAVATVTDGAGNQATVTVRPVTGGVAINNGQGQSYGL